MTTLEAFADEPLIDYLVRVLDEIRRTNQTARCHYCGHVFVAIPSMKPTELVGAWFAAMSGETPAPHGTITEMSDWQADHVVSSEKPLPPLSRYDRPVRTQRRRA